jgi:hypothetical protein
MDFIELLKTKFPAAEVFMSCSDKDFICVRSVIGQSTFHNDKGERVPVPITDTKRYHLDTIRLMILNPNFNWSEWKWNEKPNLEKQ